MTRQLSSPSTAQPWKQIDKQSPDEVDTSGSSSFMTSNKYRACSTSADQFSDIVDQAFNITTEAYSTNSLLDHYNSNGGAEKPCKPARRTDQVEKSPYQLWLPEISCWVVSFVFFTAIIGILSAYDQRRAPRLPHDISLNTIVSLLATVGTSVLMMTVASGLGQVKWNWFKTQARPMCDFQSIDAASRGPAGSFRLVIKGRGGCLAAVGAILTIIVLAIGPFVQQVISYRPRLVPTGVSSIPTAVNYTDTTGEGQIFDIDSGLILLQSSIYRGARITSSSNWDVTPFCPTGNCTWEPYQTLAICSSCKDITSLMILNNSGDTLTIPNVQSLVLWDDTGIDDGAYNNMESLALDVIDLNNVTIADGGRVKSVAFAEYTYPLDMVMIANTGHLEGTDHKVPAYVNECIFEFCVRNMTAVVENGIFTESELNVHYDPNPYVNDSIDGNYAFFLELPTPPFVFSVSSDTAFGFQMLSSGIFAGQSNYSSSIINGTWVNVLGPNFGSNVGAALWQSLAWEPHNVSQVMSNIAKSMTLALRTDQGFTTVARGTAWSEQVFVHIDWVWMILPLSLLFASLAFLLAVMFTTGRSGARVWKSGSLTTLYALEEAAKQDLSMSALEDCYEMNLVAESWLLQLEHTDDGGTRLVRVK